MKNRIKLHIDVKAIIKSIAHGIGYGWTRFKNFYKNYLTGKWRYAVRAILTFVLGVLLCILLKDFTKIPVRDYYFDIYAASYDSIVPDIKLVVGNTNMLNSYSDDFDSQGDSIEINYDFYCHSDQYIRPASLHKHANRVINGSIKRIAIVMDTINQRAMQDDRYSPFLRTYQQDKRKGLYDCRDSLHSTYIYTQIYSNLYSTIPVGFRMSKKLFGMCDTLIFHDSYAIALESFPLYSDINYFKDSTLFEKLSKNHSYRSNNHLIVCQRPKLKYTAKKWDRQGVWIQNHNRTNGRKGLHKWIPKWGLFLSKENIALKEYRFFVLTHDMDAYKITLQTRGGAIIQNNPSDELKVLSLHDTQIIKRQAKYGKDKIGLTWNERLALDQKYNNSDVFVSIPENEGLQYIRLFFVTLVIGWMLLACFKNIAKFVRKCFDV